MAFEYNDDGYNDDEVEQETEMEELEEETEQEQYEAQMQEFARKKELENKLKRIYRKPVLLHLTVSERITVNKGKKEFPALVAKIYAKLGSQKSAVATTTGGASIVLSHILFIVGIVAIAALLIALIMDSILSIFGGGSDGEGGANGSEFGTPSNYLYGVRAIYEDEQQAKEYLIDSYTQLIGKTVDYVNDNNTVYKITLTIPESLDYEAFIDDAYAGEYIHLHYLTQQLAQTIYSADNLNSPVGSFEQQLNGIKYFGYTQDILSPYSTIFSDYITQNYEDLVVANSDGNATTPNDLQNLVSTYLSSEQISNIRTEKYFILDLPSKKDANAPSIAKKRNYKAYIYLTQKSMIVDYLSYTISTDDANLSINYNNQQIALKGEPEKMYEDSELWICETQSENLNLSIAPIAENYNQPDEGKLEKSVSLYEIASWQNANIYLLQDETSNIFNYKTYGLNIQFNSTIPFAFGEFATTIK